MSYKRRFMTFWEAPMQRIGFIVLPGFQMLSVSALSVFELANWEIGEPVYDVHLLSETGGSAPRPLGIRRAAETRAQNTFLPLIVGGRPGVLALPPARAQNFPPH